MDRFELRSKFTEEFFKEFLYDAEFRSLFESMLIGMTPYEVIEHLCKSKKELNKEIKKALDNMPRKIIVTTERFEQLRSEIGE